MKARIFSELILAMLLGSMSVVAFNVEASLLTSGENVILDEVSSPRVSGIFSMEESGLSHDVAVCNVSVSPTEAYVGQTVDINVTVANNGENSEDVTTRVYYGNISEPPPPPPPPPPEYTRIYLDPSENTFYSDVTGVGDCFNVSVWCENVPDLSAAQIHLEFNDTIINVTQWWAPDQHAFLPEPIHCCPSPPNPGYVHVDPGHGYVEVFLHKPLPPMAPWGHDGLICIFEFNITAVPPEGGSLSCPLHINTTHTYLLDPHGIEVPDVTKEDGTYTLAPPPPLIQLVGEQTVNLPPTSNATLLFTWNTTGVPLGNYTVWAVAEPVAGETDTEDNIFVFGTVEISSQRDVALAYVHSTRTWVYQGGNTTFSVKVENRGDFTENVTVILYYNMTSNKTIGNGTIMNLQPDQNATVSIMWGTTGVTPCRNYTITAVATIQEPDNNPADNTLEDGHVKIRFPGDVNGDDKVDLMDYYSAALAYGSFPGHPKWNPDYDTNYDNKIDLKDIFTIAINYGKARP